MMGKKGAKSVNNTKPKEAKNCGICNKNFNKSEYKLFCSGKCARWVCQKCSGLDKSGIEELLEEDKSWLCKDCKNTSSTRKSIAIHHNSSEEEQSSDEEEKKYTISDVMRQIQRNHEISNSDMKTLKNDIYVMQQSMQFMSDSFEQLQQENKTLHKLLQEEKQKLQKANKKIENLEERMDIIEQEKLGKNLILSNVPKKENENTQELVGKIIEYMGIKIEMNNFSAKRVSQKETSPIKIELKDNKTRNQILEKRKGKGIITMKDCGYPENNTIYFNEDITKYKQELFAKARNLKKEKNLKYAWVKNGNVYIRATEDSRAVLIKNEDNLQTMMQ